MNSDKWFEDLIPGIFILILLSGILFLIQGCGREYSGTGFAPAPNHCTISQLSNGAIIACPDGSTAFIANGTQGIPGLQGERGEPGTPGTTSPYLPIGIIQPCSGSGSYKEVLLILYNGTVLASFSNNVNGDYTRFSLIPDGSFMTTDGNNCHFTISTSGNIRTCSWSGGSQSWTIP